MRQKQKLLKDHKLIHKLDSRYVAYMAYSLKNKAFDYRDLPSVITLPKYNTITHGEKCSLSEGGKLLNSM